MTTRDPNTRGDAGSASPGLLYDERYGYLIPIENVRATVRLLYPDEMTPTAERRIEAACQRWEPVNDQ